MTEHRLGPSEPRAGRVLERGRSKAYRPLPEDQRAAAVARGLAAWERGDFYQAHEEFEPAWMGTADAGERALLSGLIKLAAGFVHAARGNPLGMRTNLAGALERLAAAPPAAASALDLDLPALLALVADRLAAVEPLVGTPRPPRDSLTAEPVESVHSSHVVAGPPAASWRPPLAIPPFPLPRRST